MDEFEHGSDGIKAEQRGQNIKIINFLVVIHVFSIGS